MRELHLPSWATAKGKGRVETDAAVFYPEILAELKVTEVNRYWLEMARQVAKLDVQLAVAGTEMQAEQGGALVILIKDTTKGADGISKYAQSRYPDEDGAKLARGDLKRQYANLRGVSL